MICKMLQELRWGPGWWKYKLVVHKPVGSDPEKSNLEKYKPVKFEPDEAVTRQPH